MKPNLFSDGQLSFLQLREASSIESQLSEKDLMALESNLKELFLSQINGRKKKRYTRGGKLCASIFVQDKITYYDCTNAISPDGKDKKIEWCYIDIHAKTDKAWDYCKPIIDYDKVRERNQSELNVITIESRKVNSELSEHIKTSEYVIKEFFEIRKGHADIDNKISKMNRSLASLLNNLSFLYNLQQQWSKSEESALSIAKEIDVQEAELKKKKEAAAKKAKEYWPTDSVTLKDQSFKYNMQISPKLMRKERSSERNCNGLAGYEEDKLGNGLLGEYYDNEGLIGNSIERTDEKINFSWAGSSPIKGVNPYNFSIKWTGFLKAPFTGKYNFEIDTFDSVILNLNNKIIISHNMQTAGKESAVRTDNWLKHEVNKKKNPAVLSQKSHSKPIKLIGGNKYNYYHSVHDLIENKFKAGVKLFWSSEDFDTTTIPAKYLYTMNEFPPFAPMGLDQNEVVLASLDENSTAFKNSDAFFLQNIPQEYQGLPSLKFITRYTKASFNMIINAPKYLYVAVLSHYPNPLPDVFENMNNQMAILKIDPKKKKKNNKVSAIESGIMNIYRRKFQPGNVDVPLQLVGANIKGVPWVMFWGPDTSGATPISCGGKEVIISNYGSKSYKECKSSTNYPASKCQDAFQNKMRDSFGAMWYSSAEGIGAWIQVTFKDLYMVTKFEVQPRANPDERNKVIELEFSDGTKQSFTLINTDKRQTFTIKSVQTQYVTVRIKEVFGTRNNGGAYNFFGIECKNLQNNDDSKEATGELKAAGISPKKLPPLFKPPKDKVVNLSCRESFSNSKKFLKTKMGLGDYIIVNCFSSCAQSSFSVYGSGKYTKDSVICKAAFHDKKITSVGGQVKVIFSNGLVQYSGSKSNGIATDSKTYSEITYSFEAIKTDEEIIFQEGTLVDFLDPSANNKYLSATISNIKESPAGKQIELSIKGLAAPVTLPYPNKTRVFPCGEKIKGVDCKKSRKTVNKNRPIIIRFITKEYKVTGDFLPDFGGVYGSTGKAFGWSKDISTRLKYAAGEAPKTPMLETSVHFPPSHLSKYCKKEIPDNICDKVDWSVFAGEGKFVVKIYYGDALVNSKIDLTMNGSQVISKVVEKGKLEMFEKVVESVQGFITITSNCERDCDFSMAKLNAVEIVPFEDIGIPDEVVEEEVSCGGSIIHGKCDKGDDVLHCLFDSASNPLTKNCTGEYVLMEIDNTSLCKQDAGKYKCVKKTYGNAVECKQFCPKACRKSVCQQ